MEALPLIGPVTALELTKNHLLAGIGPWIHVFDLEKKRATSCCKCLPGSRVHGIRRRGNESSIFCAFGQKFIRIVSLEESVPRLQLIQEPEIFDDWIWDVAWVTYRNKSEPLLAIALGHNSVQLYDCGERTVLQKVQCEEICILYCAKFIGTNWDSLILAAGTVFNQVVIWAVCGQRKESFSKVLHRLPGHQGVIFSIAYHPALRYLCSVSDDRSLQLWKLEPSNAEGSHDLMLSEWDNMKFTKVYQLYGHTARVWDVQLLDQYFITIGEDSTTCVWDYSGQVVQRFKGHRGKSIWSLSSHPSQKIIATGGGDCSVRLWDLKTSEKVNPFTTKVLQLPPDVPEGDFPRTIGLQNHQSVLVLTNEGSLLQYSNLTGNWKQLLVDGSYKSYSVLAVSPSGVFAALGNINGQVKVVALDDMKTIELHVFEGKIHSIQWLGDGGSGIFLVSGPDGKLVTYEISTENGTLNLVNLFHEFTLPYCKQRWVTSAILLTSEGLLLCGDRGGTLHVYDLSDPSTNPRKTFLKVHGKSGVSHVCFHEDHVYSCGRDGRYVQYSLEDGQLKLLNGNKVTKGFEWLCRLFFTDSYIFALGFHTVNFELWSLNTNQKLLEIECGGGHRDWDFSFHDNQAVFVYIKRGEIILHEGEIHSNQQILQPPLHGRELTDVKHIMTLGDVHVLCTSSEDTDARIIAVKYDKKGNILLQPLKTLQGHLSSIRCLALSSPRSSTSLPNQSLILFTGGGRAQLKSWRLSLKFPKLSEGSSVQAGTCEDFVDKHIKDLNRCGAEISTSPVENNVDRSRKEPAFNSADKYSESDFESVNCNHELLGTHMLQYKSKKSSKPWKTFEYNPSLETRFMALTSFRASQVNEEFDDQVHFVAAACSDGFLRLFKFCEDGKDFKLVWETGYHDHCLLSVQHLITGKSLRRNVLLLSSGTDGRIAIWDITKLVTEECDIISCGATNDAHGLGDRNTTLNKTSCPGSDVVFQEPLFVIQAHQSGVNSMAIQKTEDNVHVLATGGDDNALVLTELCINDFPMTVTVLRQVSQDSAHATQITGIQFVRGQLVTVSIDQRVIVWSWSFENKTLQVSDIKFVDVADVSSCDHWSCGDKDYMMLAGTGLQLMQINQASS